MKKVFDLKRRDPEVESNLVLGRLDAALYSSNPRVKEWLEAGVLSLLSQVPFLEASLKAPVPMIRGISSNRLLTSQEASGLLNIPVRWIYRHKNKIPHRRFGRYIRFPESDLLKWIEKQQSLQK